MHSHLDDDLLDVTRRVRVQIAARRVLWMGPVDEGAGLPCELLNGRVGFLHAALFINRFVGEETVPWSITGPIVDAMLASGRAHATAQSPLMFPWRSRRFWGASHGLAGIMQVLLHFPLKEPDHRDIMATLRYMMANRYFRGNYRVSVEDGRGDRLVHWCHGAPGITMALATAIGIYGGGSDSDDIRQAAEAAADVVWERGLLRRVGLCHGISGNAYAFLALYRAWQQKRDLFRARQFAGWLLKHAKPLLASGAMHGGDHRHSLFEGLGGVACVWLDVARPLRSFFPGFEIMPRDDP